MAARPYARVVPLASARLRAIPASATFTLAPGVAAVPGSRSGADPKQVRAVPWRGSRLPRYAGARVALTRGGKHRVHAGYTFLARLAPERVIDAEALLRDYAKRDALPFAASQTTHFATVTIIPAEMYGDEPLPATLLFATSFCGPT